MRLRTATIARIHSPEGNSDGFIPPISRQQADLIRSKFYIKKHRRRAAKKQDSDRERQTLRRAAERPYLLLEREAKLREQSLRKAIQRWPSKRLEQLRGREYDIAQLWLASELTALSSGLAPSAAAIARTYMQLHPEQVMSRHQARNGIQLIATLEEPGHPWSKFRR